MISVPFFRKTAATASRRGYSLLNVIMNIIFLMVPSYFKFYLESNSLAGASFLFYLGYFARRLSVTSNVKKTDVTAFNFPSDSSYNIKVLSYNVFLRPPLIKNNNDDFKNERFAEILNQLDQFDVVCLQEIFALANWRQKRLIDVAHSKGFHYYTKSMTAPWLSGKFIDAGLVILSKYPIVESDGLIYRAGNQIDSWAAKQVIYSKIQIAPHHFIHVFTTHLQASYFDSLDTVSLVSDKARSTQVSEMADFIKMKTRNSPWPVLITGDFNINARTPGAPHQETHEYKYMMDTLHFSSEIPLRDLLKETHHGMHPITYGDVVEVEVESGNGRKEQRTHPREVILTHTADHCCALSIDYTFFQDTKSNLKDSVVQVASSRVEEFFVDPSKHKVAQLSDHYAIVTDLRITKNDLCIEG